MNNFRKYSANAISLVPGSNHGAISPLDWSPRGSGVRLDCVRYAIGVHESSGVALNQQEIDTMIACEVENTLSL